MTGGREEVSKPFRLLAIDGGGAKGMFAVGALIELEEQLGRSCNEVFDLVYGTSVGAIIAGLIATKRSAREIYTWFLKEIPGIMCQRYPQHRSRALRRVANEMFGRQRFADLDDVMLGIVVTRMDEARPMIYKTKREQAIKGKPSFVPGWGATLADAIVASCAARPYFDVASVPTDDGDIPSIDGGFVANNPCLHALIEAIHLLKQPPDKVTALSVGVGSYPEPKSSGIRKLIKKWWPTQLLETILDANVADTERLIELLFKEDVRISRVNRAYSEARYETSFLESDPDKLKFMARLGRAEVREHASEICVKLELPLV